VYINCGTRIRKTQACCAWPTSSEKVYMQNEPSKHSGSQVRGYCPVLCLRWLRERTICLGLCLTATSHTDSPSAAINCTEMKEFPVEVHTEVCFWHPWKAIKLKINTRVVVGSIIKKSTYCKSRKCVIPVVCVKLGKLYVVQHNLNTEVYLMTVMETTICFGQYWPSSGCLGNLRASYMHARAHAYS